MMISHSNENQFDINAGFAISEMEAHFKQTIEELDMPEKERQKMKEKIRNSAVEAAEILNNPEENQNA